MKNQLILIFLTFGIFAFQCGDENVPEGCINPELIRQGICSTDFTPVCGCDLKTYSNACTADLAGVKSWTLGKCK